MTLGLIVECDAPFVAEEVRRLRALGLRVEVASVFRPLPPERWNAAFGAPVDYPPPGRVGWGLRALRAGAARPHALAPLLRRAWIEGAPPRLVALAATLARRARREGWRHVHASFATFPAWTAWAVGALTGLPWSFTAHAYDVQEPRAWLGRLVREAAFVRAISAEGAARLRAAAQGDAGDVRVGGLGVDTERFRPRPGQGHGLPEIVCVARLGPTKGVPVLLAAAARLRRAGRRFTLRIIGEGALRATLEQEARALGLVSCARFEGVGERDAVVAALQRATVFALPCVALDGGRRYDGLPVALLEAMACGLPVVTTPLGGIPEVIVTGETGLLVSPGDDAALAGALSTLLGDAGLRGRLGSAARERVLRTHEGTAAARRLASWIGAASVRPERAQRWIASGAGA